MHFPWRTHIRQAYDRAISSLPNYKDQLKSSKFKVWHGKPNEAIEKLIKLKKDLVCDGYDDSKLSKVDFIIGYLTSNIDKLVNYMSRKTSNLPYTSNVAEANVESQINARFKRKQKMRWLRDNVHNLLQVRSAIYSNEWHAYQAHIDMKLAA